MRWLTRPAPFGAALLTLALAAGGCGGDAGASDGAEESRGRRINVEVERLQPAEFTELIQLTGVVEANRDVVVSAEESGVIRALPVEKGSAVSAGQPIARIDDRIVRSQVEQARARAALADETWQRRRRLWEEDRVGSELAYLEARYGAEEARASLQTLEARLARTVIRAPIEGILEDRRVEVGTMVSPGTPVARIIDLSPVKISGGVPERYASDVEPGSAVTVTLDVLPGQVFTGEITYVGAAVDRGNRTFPVELTLPNPGRALKPEMVANIELVRRTLDDALVVPREALVRVEDGFVVFVVVDRGDETVAEVRPVTVGPAQRNRVAILSGVEPGERLVVAGQHQVADGDRVHVVNAAAAGAGGAGPAGDEAPAREEEGEGR